MGWTQYHHAPANERQEITNICTDETDTRSFRPLYLSKVGSVFYVAVEVILKAPPQTPPEYEIRNNRFVLAEVIITSRSQGTWSYNAMTEYMGPYRWDAPKKLLDMLSPTTNEYANEWRHRCRQRAALASRKFEDGDIIEFAQPITFTDGAELTRFRVERIKSPFRRRTRTDFICVESGLRYSISAAGRRAWTKVTPSEQAHC